jgi:hypothetical protein
MQGPIEAEDYIDDPSIEGSEEVLRRIPPWHQPPPGAEFRPFSSAFYDDEDGHPMSVYLAKDIAEAGHTVDVVMEGHEGYALVAISVGLLRDLGQILVRSATEKEPYHALVVGAKTQGVRRRIARAARWVIEPPRNRNQP